VISVHNAHTKYNKQIKFHYYTKKKW